jgi:hypothetical protein
MRLAEIEATARGRVRDVQRSTAASWWLTVGSARAAASGGWPVEPLDLDGELACDVGQFPERAGDRAQGDAFERFAEFGDGGVEALPQVDRSAAGSGAGAQLVGELHVACAGVGAMREPEHVCVAQGGGFLLGGVGDPAHAVSEPVVRWRFDAGLQRVAPALIGELDLFERDAGIVGHGCWPGDGVKAVMWSAICRGAAVRGGEDEVAAWRRYAGEALRRIARSTSERRIRQVRPTRAAASLPVLTHARTVVGLSFSSSLTCCTVSHGSFSGVGVVWSVIRRVSAFGPFE